MGLINKLQNGESALTPYNGNTPQVNQLATAQSPLHDGYSITGQNVAGVNSLYQQYLDGTNNNLPSPSNLDMGGVPPTVSANGNALPYLNNLPG